MKSIDVKSLIIGILGTALVFVLLGVNEGSSNGRFQVECGSPIPKWCMVIDTRSGEQFKNFVAYKNKNKPDY